jgi:hypothetical protein
MSWHAIYGTGFTVHGVQRCEDGRVEFTVWLSALWLPLLPLSSWNAIYAGEELPVGEGDESHRFVDLVRVPHEWARLIQTFARGLLVAAAAVAPSLIMIERTHGRAATRAEMVIVFASAFWAAGLILGCEHLRRRRLRRDPPLGPGLTWASPAPRNRPRSRD